MWQLALLFLIYYSSSYSSLLIIHIIKSILLSSCSVVEAAATLGHRHCLNDLWLYPYFYLTSIYLVGFCLQSSITYSHRHVCRGQTHPVYSQEVCEAHCLRRGSLQAVSAAAVSSVWNRYYGCPSHFPLSTYSWSGVRLPRNSQATLF